MRFSIAALAATVASVQAFRDTSPFMIFSSSAFPDKLSSLSQNEIQPAAKVVEAATSYLQTCPSKIYYILAPPSLSSAEITARTFPSLQSQLSAPQINSRVVVPSVRGLTHQTAKDLTAVITKACGEKETKIYDARLQWAVKTESERGNNAVVVLPYSEFREGEDRNMDLRSYDAQIATLLQAHPASLSYTVLFSTGPLNKTLPSVPEAQEAMEAAYEGEFDVAVHMDLKRELRARIPPKTVQTNNLPLFETYQFLTPGLFMGILVTLILLSILGVGLSAISSLKVSYGAFEKEMGPAAQKKQG